jgi:hypothetical protein
LDGPHEAIAASRNGCDILSRSRVLSECTPQGRHVHLEVALVDREVRPSACDQLPLAHQLAWALNKCGQEVECATANANWLLILEQQLPLRK